MKEKDLEEIGIFRIPVPIPFVQAGGPVNAYVVEEERGILLLDPGIGTRLAQAALAEGLAKTGHRFEEVNRIVLSHGHIDHYGIAAWVQEQTGRVVPISIHSADAEKVLQSAADLPDLLSRNREYFAKLGVPLPILEETIANIHRNDDLGRRLPDVMPLVPGDTFHCKHATLEVLHMPGHTPGLCCFYDRKHKLLLSSDHLLERVSPNPLIELRSNGKPTPFRPLISYFESLDRVRSLAIDLVLPGHAAPFSAYLELIDSLFDFYQHRQAKILDILEDGARTAYEVMRRLFPPASGVELILTISETLGNIEMLENRGRIVREAEGEFIRFRVAA